MADVRVYFCLAGAKIVLGLHKALALATCTAAAVDAISILPLPPSLLPVVVAAVVLVQWLLAACGDVELNPGPPTGPNLGPPTSPEGEGVNVTLAHQNQMCTRLCHKMAAPAVAGSSSQLMTACQHAHLHVRICCSFAGCMHCASCCCRVLYSVHPLCHSCSVASLPGEGAKCRGHTVSNGYVR